MSTTLQDVRVGFMPLTDCASLVVAAERGFDREHGIRIILSRETSWASVRDKLGSGALDAAHALYGMVYGVELGIGCQRQDMAVLMNLSRNGQAITLARKLAGAGVVNGPALARHGHAAARQLTLAQTFPTGNHAMLMNYWLGGCGIDPLHEVRSVTVPPTQMVGSLREGMIDGFCAGEPWGARAVAEGIGVTAATSQQIWPDHPGKVLGTTAAFAERDPAACTALVAAVLEAARWIEASDENMLATADLLAQPGCLNAAAAEITPRLMGQYDNGMGERWEDPNALAFCRDGAVNFPYLSDGMWFMTQHRRWGLLKDDPDYLAVAGKVNRVELYRQGAQLAGVAVPTGLLRSSVLIDGVTWDGTDPKGYAASFSIRAA
jgi:nitrate/nitrite transport system substrate-binding protein